MIWIIVANLEGLSYTLSLYHNSEGSVSSGLGNFCLMAGGSWGGNGDTPVHPNAWCKAQQGWITVINQTGANTVTLSDVKTGHQALRLWSSGVVGSEYFLLENRQTAGFDQSLPGGDLLVYHVDETQAGNTNRNRYKVGLVQADGKRELENGTNRGDAADPWPGTGGNTTLDQTSTPNTNSYAPGATSVAVRNIAVATGSVSFDASV
jgi:immune inhibitor A